MKLFAYLVKSNDLSMDMARAWCFDQYAQDDVPEWIHEISIDTGKDELLELLKLHYDVDGSIDFEFEVGAYCQWYKEGGFKLYSLVQNLLVFMDKQQLIESDFIMLHGAQELFKVDKDAANKVAIVMEEFIEKYALIYNQRMTGFMQTMELETLK